MSIAGKVGCTPETLRKWGRQSQRDADKRPGLTAGERDPAQSFVVFRSGGARLPIEVTIDFIDQHLREHGVEPICAVLPIAPATNYAHQAHRADPSKIPARAKRDDELRPEIRRVWSNSYGGVYGAFKVRRQLRRDDVVVARCTVARLMSEMVLRGAVRG